MFNREQYRMQDVYTPEAMRAEIFHLSHHDPLVRNCMTAVDMSGASAEDRYTMLAYHALKIKAELSALVLDFHRTHVPPTVTKPDGATGEVK